MGGRGGPSMHCCITRCMGAVYQISGGIRYISISEGSLYVARMGG
jgi:hypothetical protein